MKAIENDNQEYPNISYPLNFEPSQAEQEAFKVEINKEFSKYLNNNEDNWQNLSLLMLILEKFGSCLSFGESDVTLVDMAKATAAIAHPLTTLKI